MGAGTQWMTAVSSMLAKDAIEWLMGRSHVTLRKELVLELQPKYLWHNIWEGNDFFSKSSANWSETAKPLDPTVTKTIHESPHLFYIITPINVNCFEELLKSHPNQPFVKSVLRPPWRFLVMGWYLYRGVSWHMRLVLPKTKQHQRGSIPMWSVWPWKFQGVFLWCFWW